jgi:anaerobic magnesium-protoporphyrin IX monomethyl ester cyclase
LKVLVIWPPHVPSYFNAGHHSPLYQTASYLRTLPESHEVVTCEAGLLNMNWKAVGDLLFQGDFDVIAVMNDFDAVDGLERFIHYARELTPKSKLIAFGRLSNMNPGFFTALDFDAVVVNGDFECGVAGYLTALAGGGPVLGLPGTFVRAGEEWLPPSGNGLFLPAEEWALPEIAEIPYRAYDQLYAQDTHKFCGIPFRRELVVPVSRGCPIGCDYCDVHQIFGLAERRLSVDAVLAYVDECFAKEPFEYVAFYAPTFTLKKAWVRELCDRLTARDEKIRWKCATTVHHLDEDLVSRMGASGCVRISVGLETLEPAGHGALPRAKQIHEEQFRELGRWCAEAGIELNAFVIVGLPGTSAEGVARTRVVVTESGARFRPTVYTPFERMTPAMRADELNRYNRQTFLDGALPPGTDTAPLYRYVFGVEERITSVHEQIPQRSEHVAS